MHAVRIIEQHVCKLWKEACAVLCKFSGILQRLSTKTQVFRNDTPKEFAAADMRRGIR